MRVRLWLFFASVVFVAACQSSGTSRQAASDNGGSGAGWVVVTFDYGEEVMHMPSLVFYRYNQNIKRFKRAKTVSQDTRDFGIGGFLGDIEAIEKLPNTTNVWVFELERGKYVLPVIFAGTGQGARVRSIRKSAPAFSVEPGKAVYLGEIELVVKRFGAPLVNLDKIGKPAKLAEARNRFREKSKSQIPLVPAKIEFLKLKCSRKSMFGLIAERCG